jgi:DNA-binding LytR/AlgR family response regulator
MAESVIAMTVLLADDDEAQLHYMQGLIANLRPHWTVVASLRNLDTLPEVLEAERPSLCILDIGFEHSNGIEVIRKLSDPPPVIYVTGDASSAVMAFEASAVDFVVKPAQRVRFELALARAEKQAAHLAAAARTLAEQAANGRVDPPTMVRILRGDDLIIAPIDDVLYLQADRKHTRVVLPTQEGMLRMALHAIEPYVDANQFWRIHRGYIINARRALLAKRDDLGRLFIRMQNRPESLPVARPYEHLFRNGFF